MRSRDAEPAAAHTTPDVGADDGRGAFRFRPLTEPDARQIARWRYPAPYDFYHLHEDAWPDLIGLGPDFQAVDLVPGSVPPVGIPSPGRGDRWLPRIARRAWGRARPTGPARRDPAPAVAGFVCFGVQAQVSGARDAGLYAEDALDIGLGLRPDLTGQGLGKTFFAACLDHAIQTRQPATLRLAVASFNTRAIAVYRRAGFRPVATCESPVRGRPVEFLVMVRNATGTPSPTESAL